MRPSPWPLLIAAFWMAACQVYQPRVLGQPEEITSFQPEETHPAVLEIRTKTGDLYFLYTVRREGDRIGGQGNTMPPTAHSRRRGPLRSPPRTSSSYGIGPLLQRPARNSTSLGFRIFCWGFPWAVRLGSSRFSFSQCSLAPDPPRMPGTARNGSWNLRLLE